jgi:hypothetical protein
MRCSGLVLAAALAVFPVLARADVHVTVSKSQQVMVVSIDGGPTYRWPVSTGRAGYNTPNGNYNAIRLERVYYSKKYDDAPMPNSVFFYGGYAIHGTLEERKLGNAVSHGCVRLSRANAALLYSEVLAHGMSRTHIRITDGPVYGGPVVARGYEDDHRGNRRNSYDASARRYDRGRERVDHDDARAYRGRVVTRGSNYRGFEEFDAPRYREPSRRVYWETAPRRVYRDYDGWRRY